MVTETKNYELENPGNIRERLTLYSNYVRRMKEQKDSEETKKEIERKEN